MSSSLKSQTSAGTDFWLTSMLNWTGSDSFFVIISAEKPTNASVEIPRLGFSRNISLSFNDLQRIYIPSGYKPGTADTVYNCGIHVSSDLPVSVYTLSAQGATTDASCIFPTSIQPRGGTYYISNPVVYSSGYNIGNNAGIVAIDDTVTIDITPTVNTSSGYAAGVKYTKRLLKGQVYMFSSSSKTGLQGSLIKAAPGKRIAVFSGDRCVAVRCAACDHVYEEIPPTTVFGKSFVITPFLNQNKGYDYQVVAMDAGTRVEENGVLLTTLNAGQTYYRKVWGDSSFCISTSKPALLVQYMTGITCQSPSGGDPAMLVINPLEQTINYAMVSTSNTILVKTHFLTIAVPKAGLDSVYLDGGLLSRSDFDTVSCGNYFFYRSAITAGNHRIQCRYGFICYLYGIGFAESYAYSAGMGMRNLQRYIVSESYPGCDSGFVVKLISKGDSATSFRWTFNKNQQDTAVNPYFYVSKPGVYPVKLRYKLLNSKTWDSTITDVLVEKPLYNDFITFSQRVVCDTAYTLKLPNTSVFSYLWSTGETTSAIRVNKTGKYKVRITNRQTGCVAWDSCTLTFRNAIRAGFRSYSAKSCPGIPLYLYDTSKVTDDTIVSYRWITDGYLRSTRKNDTIKSPRANNYEIKLVISTVKGCMDSAYKTILISDIPQARAGVVRYDSCFGTNKFRFNNGSTTNVGRITRLKWMFSDGDTSNRMQPEKSFADSGLHHARLIAFSETGCVDTTDKIPVRVHPLPRTAMRITDSSVCLKGNFFEFYNNTPRDGRAQNFLWAFGDGSGTTLENPERIPYLDTGRYLVKFVASFSATGCGDTARRYVRVYPGPKASISVDSNNFCLNRNFYQFRNSSDKKGYPTETLTWDWNDGTQTKDSSQFRKVFTRTGTFRVRLFYQTGKGCHDTATKNVVVFSSPDAAWVVTDSNICGKNNYFNLSNRSVAPGNARWNWSFGDGNGSTIREPGKISYLNPGKYRVSLAVRDPLTGCTDTFARQVGTFGFPALKPILSDTAVCLPGDTIEFTDSTVYGQGTAARRWVFSNGSDTAFRVKRSFGMSGIQQILLIGGVPGICADTALLSVRVRYSGNPLKAGHVLKSPCAPSKADLNASGGAVGWTYLWKDAVNNRQWSGSAVSDVSFLSAGTFPLLLQATDQSGCIFNARDTLELFSAPVVSLSVTGSDKQCLKGNGFSFSAGVNGGQLPLSHSWSLDEGQTSVSTDPGMVRYANAGTKTIRLIIADNRGCSDTALASVQVWPMPDGRVTDDSGCTGSMLTLRHQNTMPAGQLSAITWYINNQPVHQGEPYRHQLGVPGRNQVFVVTTSSDGCTDTSNTAFLISQPRPVAAYGVKTGLATALGIPVEFLDSSLGATRWDWMADEGIFGTGREFSHLYGRTGPVITRLIVTNDAGCTDTAIRFMVLESGTDGWLPNAFTPDGSGLNDRFKIGGLSAVSSFRMSIYNRWGEKVFETANPDEGWDGTFAGKPVPEGHYACLVSVIYFNGQRRTFRGQIAVLR